MPPPPMPMPSPSPFPGDASPHMAVSVSTSNLGGEVSSSLSAPISLSADADAVVDDDDDDLERVALLPANTAATEDRETASSAQTSSEASSSSPAFSLREFATRGEVCLFVATFIYALQGYVAKVLEQTVPAIEVVLVRSVFSGMITVATGIQVNRHENGWANKTASERFASVVGKRENCRLLLIRGIFGASAFNLAYAALPYLPLGDHTALFFLNPIFIALASWPVLGEKVTLADGASIVAAFTGTLLIVRPTVIFGGAPQSSSFWLGIWLQLGAALLAAAAMLTVRYIGKRETPLVVAVWFQGLSGLSSASLLLTPLGALLGQIPIVPNAKEAALLGVVSCTSYAAQILLNRGYQVLPPARASGIAYLQCLWSAMLGAVALGEAVTWPSMLGAVLICGGGLAAALYKKKENKAVRGGGVSKEGDRSTAAMRETELVPTSERAGK
ncbi:EamA domain-containing protein [Pseudoscourfieldia marina]